MRNAFLRRRTGLLLLLLIVLAAALLAGSDVLSSSKGDVLSGSTEPHPEPVEGLAEVLSKGWEVDGGE